MNSDALRLLFPKASEDFILLNADNKKPLAIKTIAPNQTLDGDNLMSLWEEYQKAGSVHKTGKLIGVCGQTVKNRLNKAGYKLNDDKWSEAETAILLSYYANTPPVDFSILKLATSLHRTFASVALKASKMGVSGKRTDSSTFSDDHKANLSTAMKKRMHRDGTESLTRGLRKYMQGGESGFAGHEHTEENKKAASLRFKAWHGSNPHPRGMLGKKHTKEFCEKISKVHLGKKLPREQVMRMLKTKEANGTLVNPRPEASWKCGWEEFGGKRFYARSRWEANYGRYLEFLKKNGEILDWDHEPKTFWFEGIKRGVMSYLPDFWVKTKSGEEYHEVKGWMDARSITKIKRMAKYHPAVKLQVIDSVRYRALAKQLKQIVPGWAP